MSYSCTSFAPAGRQAIRISPRLLESFTHLTTRLAFCILLFSVSIPAYAQPASCCQSLRTQGQTAFNNKDYAKAITHWTNGKKCSDAAKCPDLNALIQKARTEQQKQKDAAATAERQRIAAEQERDRKAAAERQRLAAEQDRQRKATEAQAAYNLAKRLDTKEAYQAFIADHKSSPLVADAQKRIAELGKPAPSSTEVAKKTEPAAAPAGMARISGGAYDMGCTSEQKDCDSDESPVTRVTISDFYIGKYEVTVREFQQFINATGYKTDADKDGWSYLWSGSDWEKKNGVNWKYDVKGNTRPSSEYDHPVIHVSWNDAVAYCNWLSEKENLSKVYTISGSTVTANWSAKGYRLPTEAEWEYAARGRGQKVLFGNGKNVADPAAINFAGSASAKKDYSIAGEYRQKTVPVGSLNSPNTLGLHDMSGNVWEWCWDWKAAYPGGSKDNYRGPDSGSHRVRRGGSWVSDPDYVRVALRSGSAPGVRDYVIGFRLARTP